MIVLCLAWLVIYLFAVAHKGCDCFVFDLVSDVVVCCCSQSVGLFCALTWLVI